MTIGQLPSWRVYRVICVTDQKNTDSLNHLHHPDYELSLSASTYCAPGTTFWLAESGIECPGSECILLECNYVYFGTLSVEPLIVEFEWDGGRYVGSLEDRNNYKPSLRWANDQTCDAIVCDISSL